MIFPAYTTGNPLGRRKKNWTRFRVSKPSRFDRLFRGLPVRGLQTTLWLEQSAFGSEGELYLFGTVLARFFSLYASVNSFHLLKVINLDNQECYQWPVQTGQHALM